MVVFNYSGAEINAKVVYYGPALSGKTTNLECIYEKMPDDTKGKMVSMKTRTDRTLFFDFLPLDVGEINGYRTRILLYTVPGQVYYNATRKLVLKGADAVVFVADSSASKMQENLDSLRNLEENLNEHGLTLDTMPWVMQYNKRDLPDALPVDQLAAKLNLLNVPSYEATATTGHGIYDTFRAVAGLLYRQLVERLKHAQPAPDTAEGKQPAPQTPVSLDGQPIAPPTREPQRPANEAPVAKSPPPQAQQSIVDEPIAEAPSAQQEAPEEHEDSNMSVADVVDTALREVAPESAPRGQATATAGPTPKTPAPPPASATRQPTPQTVDRPPQQSGDSADESLDRDFHFATLDKAPRGKEDVGRVIDFEDTQAIEKPETAEGEFIVDPFQRKSAKQGPRPTEDAPEPASAQETPMLEEETPAAETEAVPAVSPQDPPARSTDPTRRDGERVAITVPVLLKLSQIEKGVPIKIELEIEIDDENM